MSAPGGRGLTARAWDKALRIQTEGREDESGARYMPYEPTPYCVLERLAESGFIRAADHVLDYGCGKGRVAFFLAARIGCRVTGIDHSEKLVAMAEANRARAVGAALTRFERIGAERYAPRDENVFFFFNPFSEDVLRIVLRRVAGADRGRVRLVFYYPSDAYRACLAEAGWLRPAGSIDCRDLFGGDPREFIRVYDAADQSP